jgi:VIT1/CCC1 family predicted Fe2+/Mn2+ transporter
LTGVALFGVGMALSLFSGRSALRGGARMLLIGAAAAACTFAVGHAMGTALG